MTWILDSEGVLTISGTGAMSDFASDAKPFGKHETIKSIVIKDGVW